MEEAWTIIKNWWQSGLCGGSPAADEVGKAGDGIGGDAETIAEVGPERDGVFLAGLFQRQEGIPASSAIFATRARADFSYGDRIADILFGTVGIEGNLGPVEHDQQLGFPLFESGQRVVEGGKAGDPVKDAIEPGLERYLGLRRRAGAINLEVVIEPPDQQSHQGNGSALGIRNRNQAIDQALRVDPTCARRSPGKENGYDLKPFIAFQRVRL